jgi:hypothetical protein
MSDIYQGGAPGASGAGPQQSSGTVETAKQEAAGVKDTAMQEAGGVVDSAKSEAAAVTREAKNQIKDLYAQSRQELSEQAATQQRRVAEGLRSVGGELRSMADNAEGGGVGADLVRQTSDKVSSVAQWIGDRDPGSLLGEVKSYARRRPGVFIAVAALAGLAAGRLTRALTESAADDSSSSSQGSAGATRSPAPTSGAAAPGATTSGVTPSAVPASADAAIPQAPDGRTGDLGASADTPLFNRTDAATRDPYREDRP